VSHELQFDLFKYFSSANGTILEGSSTDFYY